MEINSISCAVSLFNHQLSGFDIRINKNRLPMPIYWMRHGISHRKSLYWKKKRRTRKFLQFWHYNRFEELITNHFYSRANFSISFFLAKQRRIYFTKKCVQKHVPPVHFLPLLWAVRVQRYKMDKRRMECANNVYGGKHKMLRKKGEKWSR